MFTGIIQEVGEIQQIQHQGGSAKIVIHAPGICKEAKPGDSICTNGVCLTAVVVSGDCFHVDVSQETLSRSTLQSVKTGEFVNLEPSLRPQDRMGGHIVSGHVDGVGVIEGMPDKGAFINMTVRYPESLAPFIAEKGSIAVDGISLTVTFVSQNSFGVALVPYTLHHTNLSEKRQNSPVNLEVDVIARYVQRMLHLEHPRSGITLETLRRHGYL